MQNKNVFFALQVFDIYQSAGGVTIAPKPSFLCTLGCHSLTPWLLGIIFS